MFANTSTGKSRETLLHSLFYSYYSDQNVWKLRENLVSKKSLINPIQLLGTDPNLFKKADI